MDGQNQHRTTTDRVLERGGSSPWEPASRSGWSSWKSSPCWLNWGNRLQTGCRCSHRIVRSHREPSWNRNIFQKSFLSDTVTCFQSVCSPSSHHSTGTGDEAICQHLLVLVKDKMFSLEVRLRVQDDLMKTVLTLVYLWKLKAGFIL